MINTKNKPNWTLEDNAKAMHQGWLVANVSHFGERVCVIQRYDERNRFPSDEAAAAYVVGRAEMGDTLAKKALKVIGTAYRQIGSLRNPEKLIA